MDGGFQVPSLFKTVKKVHNWGTYLYSATVKYMILSELIASRARIFSSFRFPVAEMSFFFLDSFTISGAGYTGSIVLATVSGV